MNSSYSLEALSKIHDRASFNCSNEALNYYLKQQASQDDRKNLARCFVAVDKERGFLLLDAQARQLILLF